MYQNCKPCSINPDRDSSPANSTSLVESPLAEDKIENDPETVAQHFEALGKVNE